MSHGTPSVLGRTLRSFDAGTKGLLVWPCCEQLALVCQVKMWDQHHFYSCRPQSMLVLMINEIVLCL